MIYYLFVLLFIALGTAWYALIGACVGAGATFLLGYGVDQVYLASSIVSVIYGAVFLVRVGIAATSDEE